MVIVISKKIASDNFILPDTNLKFNQQNYLKFYVEKDFNKKCNNQFSKLIMMPFLCKIDKIYNTITTQYSLNHTLRIYRHFYI